MIIGAKFLRNLWLLLVSIGLITSPAIAGNKWVEWTEIYSGSFSGSGDSNSACIEAELDAHKKALSACESRGGRVGNYRHCECRELGSGLVQCEVEIEVTCKDLSQPDQSSQSSHSKSLGNSSKQKKSFLKRCFEKYGRSRELKELCKKTDKRRKKALKRLGLDRDPEFK